MRDDAECVYTLAHERCDGCIDQSVPLELRASLEDVGHEDHPEVASFFRAGVPGVLGTVVDNFK